VWMKLDRQPFARRVVKYASTRSNYSSLDRDSQFFDGSKYGFFAGGELYSVHADPMRRRRFLAGDGRCWAALFHATFALAFNALSFMSRWQPATGAMSVSAEWGRQRWQLLEVFRCSARDAYCCSVPRRQSAGCPRVQKTGQFGSGNLPQTLPDESQFHLWSEGLPVLLRLALLQGVFYVLTGVWPLVDIGSFQLVTGPKTDLWLVKTVGVLVCVIGAVLLAAARRRSISDELVLLAMGSALGLAAIDIIYSVSGRISAIYLGDALVEIGLAALWAIAWRRTRWVQRSRLLSELSRYRSATAT
jgi:hypothetical protein